MKQLRLFFAIDLPEDIKNSLLFKTQKENTDIWRWTTKDNLHLTLEFIGDSREEDLIRIIEAGEKAFSNFSPFVIKIEKLSFDPRKRMIWAILEETKILEKVKNELQDNLLEQEVDFKIENRKFHPHITIARLKNEVPKPLNEYNSDYNAIFSVNEVLLMQSELKPSGPTYSIIQSFPL